MGESWFHREFLTPRRLVFNILFYGTHFGLFAYGWHSQATNPRLAGLNTLKYSVWLSRGAGLVLAFDGGLILLPMLRNIIRVIRPRLTWAFPADENIWFHRQVAYSMAFWAMVHTTSHYVNFINVERTQIRKETALDIHYTQPGGITGHFMLLIMVLMYTTAHQKIRKQCFEAFWYTHHLAFFFMLGLYTHATGCFVRDSVDPDYISTFPFYSTKHCLGYLSWRFTIWPGIIYFGERVYREIRARRATRLSKVLVHPSGAMELRIVKPSFKYTPGQWLFVQIPELSKFQWHPALGSRLGVGPAVVAAMTSAAMKGAEKDSKTGITRGDFVELDPAVSSITLPQDVFGSQVAILVGAGIGVTPFASILKHIGSLRRVEFFWVCRDAPSFGWFQSLLQEVEAAQADLRPLTLLRSRTMFGRPDWKTIFSTMRQAIDTSQLKTKVAVYVLLRPGVIAKALKEACVENTNSNVEFSFAKEHF
ncbi:NADPH oxidase isoform 1 [Pholiota molesta]|nr:NADPH oxidase isoform 1 [Pholiota molesta]